MKKQILCAALLTGVMALPLMAQAETVRYNDGRNTVIHHTEQQPIYRGENVRYDADRYDTDRAGADGYNRYDNDVRSNDGSFAMAPVNNRTVAQALQQSLKDSGFYKGSVNSRWDAESKAALASYQMSKGMPATGVLNQETVTRLGLVMPAADQVSEQATPLANKVDHSQRMNETRYDRDVVAHAETRYDRTMRSAEQDRMAYHTTYSNLNSHEVQIIQQNLRNSGFYKASVDGVWGPQTAQSVRDFQIANGLPASGKLTGATLDEMGLQVSEMSQITNVEPASGTMREERVIMKRDVRH